MAKKDGDGDAPHLSVVASEDEKKPPVSQRQATRKVQQESRRIEALSLKLAGLTYDQIADRLDCSRTAAREMVNRNLERADQREVENMRAVENARLDRAQAAIWSKVLDGDYKAIDSFLRISARRARVNGMDAPTKVDLSLSIRNEMEDALRSLEHMVLGEVIEGEVISDSDES